MSEEAAPVGVHPAGWPKVETGLNDDDYAALYPEGRTFYYEGDDPAKFVETMRRLGALGTVEVSVRVRVTDPALARVIQDRCPVGT